MEQRRPALPALTGLRFAAALGVVLTHSLHSLWGAPLASATNPAGRLLNNVSQNGYLGVNVFFLLSGFILTYTYVGSQGLVGTKRAFWVARFARIYPVYLLAWFTFGGLVLWHHIADWWPTSPALTGISSLFLLQSWWPTTAYYWNGPGWTLADEAVFYASFPLLIPALRLSTRVLMALLGSLYGMVCVLAFLDTQFAALPATSRNPLSLLAAGDPLVRLPEFAAGMILGTLFIRRVVRPSHMRPLALPALLLCVAGLAIGGGLSLVGGEHGLLDPIFALLILSLAYGAGGFARVCSTRLMVLLGEASYAVYILHEPIALWLQVAGVVPASDSPRFWLFLVLYVALVLIISILVYHFIETPTRRLIRRRWSAPAARSPGTRRVLLAALIAASSLLVWQLTTQAHPNPPIGFIGDSITIAGGAGHTPADVAAALRHTTAVNLAVSGTTTAYWLPNGQPFRRALTIFQSAGVRLIHIMLGTNDAKPAHRVALATYLAHMRAIAGALDSAGLRVVVSCSPYAVPGSHHGLTDAATDTTLRAYCAALATLPGVRRGDTTTFGLFRSHPSLLYDGIHPTAAGVRTIGAAWAARL